MKTMYKAEIEQYTDMEGRYTGYVMSGTYQSTLDEALALVSNHKKSNYSTGNYRIVAVTMDEATFTYTAETVVQYNYYKEVGRWIEADKMIAHHQNQIDEIEASKCRVRTETGMAKKNKEIAYHADRIAEYEAKKEKWRNE